VCTPFITFVISVTIVTIWCSWCVLPLFTNPSKMNCVPGVIEYNGLSSLGVVGKFKALNAVTGGVDDLQDGTAAGPNAPAGDEIVAWLTPATGAPTLIASSRSTAKALSRAERVRCWVNIEASFVGY
jgi:hypothetical protein